MPYEQIRPDLWNAILDYSSGRKYVWADGKARPIDPTEPTAGLTLVPTVSADEYGAWKQAFAAGIDPNRIDAKGLDQVQVWAAKNLPTAALPRPLQGLWNGTLKKHVRQRLDQWFSGQETPAPPTDLVTAKSESKVPEDLAIVRALAQECVGGMSWRQLSELKLPATSLLKIGERILSGNARLDLLNACGSKVEGYGGGAKKDKG